MGLSKTHKVCKHCAKEFTPSKYHVNSQIYCTDEKCKKERIKIRNDLFVSRNPTYHKKRAQKEDVKKVKNGNRRAKRKIERFAERVFEEQKQVIVANSQSVASVLNFYLFTFMGMTSTCMGGVQQSSALNLCNLINNFYKDGVSLVNSDANFKSKLEVINEFVVQLTQSPTPEEIAEVFQLAGSSIGS